MRQLLEQDARDVPVLSKAAAAAAIAKRELVKQAIAGRLPAARRKRALESRVERVESSISGLSAEEIEVAPGTPSTRSDPVSVDRVRDGRAAARSRLPVRVVAAEDSYVVREFLAITLDAAPEVELVAVCSDGNQLRNAVGSHMPDVVVTDIRMPPSGHDEGLRVAAELRERQPEIGVVVLSQYAEPAYALSLLGEGSGGRAYLLKERVRDRDELLRAIDAVAGGGSVIDPAIVDVLIAARARAARSRLSELTPRERELLAEIATGKSNGAIAESLYLSKRAVEKHVNSIFSKLDLPDTHDVSRRVKAALIFLSEENDGSP